MLGSGRVDAPSLRCLMIASRGSEVHAHPPDPGGPRRRAPAAAPRRETRPPAARGPAPPYYSGKPSEVSSTSRSTTAFSSPVSAYVAS